METALSARRPCAGAVPGRWGACLAVRTPPAARFRSYHDARSIRVEPPVELPVVPGVHVSVPVAVPEQPEHRVHTVAAGRAVPVPVEGPADPVPDRVAMDRERV